MKSSISGSWEEAIADHDRHLEAVPVASTTRYTRRQQLGRCARGIGVADPWAVDGRRLLAWWSGQSWAADTRRGHRAALRSFYSWGVQEGRCASSPALTLPRVHPSPPRPSPVPDDVYAAAVAVASPRVRLMLLLEADHGLRRAEVAQVHSRDLVEDLDGWSLLVHGKGSRDRWVPLTVQAARLLRQLPAGYAFPGRIDGHLSPRRVGELVGEVLPRGWSGHKLRHRAGSRWWQASGGDLAAVQDLLGHADPKTTRIYVATDRGRLRRILLDAAA